MGIEGAWLILGGHGVDTERVRAHWNDRGFSCGLWVDPPGQVWSDFVHETDELLMPVEGEIELTVMGRTWRPALGEEVLMPAGAIHTVRNVGV
ncbi:MAG: cupin domain-containing protein, partial [Candidatus Competibacter sp.]